MKRSILKRLEEQKNEVLKRFPEREWLVIALYGSQNYRTQTESSDIDSKMIVFPTFEEIVFNKKMISHVVEMPDNKEQIDVKDLRLMIQNFKKQNINYLEILFTEYFIVNPKYQKFWIELKNLAEDIARINILSGHKAIKGMMMQKRTALCHRFPSLVEKIDKYGYDPKQLLHIIRLEKFLEDYLKGIPFAECLLNFPKSVCDLLRSGDIPKEDAIRLADYSIEKINKIEYIETETNEETIKKIDKIIIESISEVLRKELLK